MHSSQIALLQFARERKKSGFTHRDFNFFYNTTASTIRLSELRALGFIFLENKLHNNRKIFYLKYEPEKFRKIKPKSCVIFNKNIV